MKIKKIFAALSAAAMIVSASAVNVSANLPTTPAAGDNCYLEFEPTGDGAYITGAYDDEGNPTSVETIAIPEKTEAGIPIVGIKGFAFADCQCLESVVVPPTVTHIDDAAFLRTQDLTEFINEETMVPSNRQKLLAYAANTVNFMGRNDWTGNEPELETAQTVLENVHEKVLTRCNSSDPSRAMLAKVLYNWYDLSDIVRGGDEDTLEKMSMKSYEAFVAWVKIVPYLDTTIIAYEDSYAAEYAKGKAILGMKFESDLSYEQEHEHLRGDANQDGKVNVRDCAAIANALATGTVDKLGCSQCADYNEDGTVNVRDAAQLAYAIAIGAIKTNDAVPSSK